MALSLDFAASKLPGGRYPPPLFRGARTFLAVLANPAAARPPGRTGCRGWEDRWQGWCKSALAIVIYWVHINFVRVEFDPIKDDANRAKHGISLQAASSFDWDTALEREDDRFDYGEVRFIAIGLIADRLYVMAFAEGSDDDAVRVISLRPAEKHEVRFYYGQI